MKKFVCASVCVLLCVCLGEFFLRKRRKKEKREFYYIFLLFFHFLLSFFGVSDSNPKIRCVRIMHAAAQGVDPAFLSSSGNCASTPCCAALRSLRPSIPLHPFAPTSHARPRSSVRRLAAIHIRPLIGASAAELRSAVIGHRRSSNQEIIRQKEGLFDLAD